MAGDELDMRSWALEQHCHAAHNFFLERAFKVQELYHKMYGCNADTQIKIRVALQPERDHYSAQKCLFEAKKRRIKQDSATMTATEEALLVATEAFLRAKIEYDPIKDEAFVAFIDEQCGQAKNRLYRRLFLAALISATPAAVFGLVQLFAPFHYIGSMMALSTVLFIIMFVVSACYITTVIEPRLVSQVENAIFLPDSSFQEKHDKMNKAIDQFIEHYDDGEEQQNSLSDNNATTKICIINRDEPLVSANNVKVVDNSNTFETLRA